MALRIVATRPNPALVTLPWHLSLEEWGDDVVVPLPRGLSRHIVRIVRLRRPDATPSRRPASRWPSGSTGCCATCSGSACRPSSRVGVVTGRETPDGEELEPALVTRAPAASRCPTAALFSHGLPHDSLPKLVDALVVLLVRLHLADFFWGDVSLSNVLFRRSAGGFAAYLVDAETGELHADAVATACGSTTSRSARERLRRAARPPGRRAARRRRARPTRSSSAGPGAVRRRCGPS